MSDMSNNDIAVLQLACYIAPADVLRSYLKISQKKGNHEREQIIQEVMKLRKITTGLKDE